MKIGIDLGTANILVYVKGKGVVLNEPSVVAIREDDNKLVAVGEEAREMIGRTPGNVRAIRPMRDGVIADYLITEAMLRYVIDKVGHRFRLFKPEVMISVPSGVTSVEKRAVRDAALKAGAKDAYLIEEPLAAAIGSNVPISGPSGNMIIDIGGGTSEIAVIALGGIVVSDSLRVGGNRFDESIANYIRRKYNLMIGDRTAEAVKIEIGSALPLDEPLRMEVKGRDMIAGLPRTIPITSTEITEAIEQPLQAIITAVRNVLEQTPPELIQRHHRQGDGDDRRWGAAAQPRQAADPGDRHPVPRGRERAQQRRRRHRDGARAVRELPQEPGQPTVRPRDVTIAATATELRTQLRDERATTGKPASRKAFADFHIHTRFSRDSLLSEATFIEKAIERGLTHVAITNHNNVEGAIAVRDKVAELGLTDRLTVILGEEVSTADGEVVGLFLTRTIPRGLSANETADEIHRQGGLVSIPHPFDPFRASHIKEGPLRNLADVRKIDMVEVFNCRVTLQRHNLEAAEFAAQHGIPGIAASDSHSSFEVAMAFNAMPHFETADELRTFLAGQRLARQPFDRPHPPHDPLGGVEEQLRRLARPPDGDRSDPRLRVAGAGQP